MPPIEKMVVFDTQSINCDVCVRLFFTGHPRKA